MCVAEYASLAQVGKKHMNDIIFERANKYHFTGQNVQQTVFALQKISYLQYFKL